jgi:hypothetical protein
LNIFSGNDLFRNFAIWPFCNFAFKTKALEGKTDKNNIVSREENLLTIGRAASPV